MTFPEQLYLALVVGSFVAFSISLAGVAWAESRAERLDKRGHSSRDQKLSWSPVP
ncbi:MAG TPA: hypothetical protein VMF53_12475 [Alphaproteobacteria bacterium]|nr:hypothetical protein [Alphaproteobacteria bacterium]